MTSVWRAKAFVEFAANSTQWEQNVVRIRSVFLAFANQMLDNFSAMVHAWNESLMEPYSIAWAILVSQLVATTISAGQTATGFVVFVENRRIVLTSSAVRTPIANQVGVQRTPWCQA